MDDWEGFWDRVKKLGSKRQLFWDCPPESASLKDLERLMPHFPRDLPLLDLGCGHGRQTRFLARHFGKVVGADFSAAALQIAQLESVSVANIEYRSLDAAHPREAQLLQDEYGDFNVYMRGVLHAVKRSERPAFAESLKILLGGKGVLYMIELPLTSYVYWRTLPDEIWGFVPSALRRAGFDFQDRERFFPDECWEVLEQGENVTMTATLPNNREAQVPAIYMILKPRGASPTT